METAVEPHKEFSLSKMQVIPLAVVLVLIGILIFGRQSGRFGAFRNEPVAIPSGTPYAEAVVSGFFDEQNIVAERILRPDAEEKETALPKKMEILTDEKTVFAEMTTSGPVKISRARLAAGDIVWIYNRIRSFEEVLKAPADPDIAIPFEEMAQNPRERIRAEYIVLVSNKK